MSQSVWQHPHVNIFRHCEVGKWRKCSKSGDVSSFMDKAIKGTVYRISGPIPAANYIQLPATSSQSLALTGRYLCFLLRPLSQRYFVVHVDVVVAEERLLVRVSFGNIFRSLKATQTWLQVPVLASSTDVSRIGASNGSAPPPMGNTRWTLLVFDCERLLSTYLNRRYGYIKAIRLCANMLVKTVFTSDVEYDHLLSGQPRPARHATTASRPPLPREFSFPLLPGTSWNDIYNCIRFPPAAESTNTMAENRSSMMSDVSGSDETRSSRRSAGVHHHRTPADRKLNTRTEEHKAGVQHAMWRIKAPQANSQRAGLNTAPKTGRPLKTLLPDPIMELSRVIGFGGCTTRELHWTRDGSCVVYPCHAIIVVVDLLTGKQRFLIGHTDKVSCLAFNGSTTLLASGQTGALAVARLWDFPSRQCLAIMKSHPHSLHSLSMSFSGTTLCGVGRDSHNKQLVIVWDASTAAQTSQVTVMSKAHTNVDISRMRLADFDDTRMVSCGRENVRFWRVRSGGLRSAPVNLGEHHGAEVTDVVFEAACPGGDSLDRRVYACTSNGVVLLISYKRVQVLRAFHINCPAATQGKAHALLSVCVNEAFVVVGSADGYLRMWPLDFSHVFIEAEHDSAVTAVAVSSDGLKIVCATKLGQVGCLDASSRTYNTLVRSHTASVLSASVDATRRQLLTASDDGTIRIWHLDTFAQIYDFRAPNEVPSVVAFHPLHQCFAAGFATGFVRMFHVPSTRCLAEHRQHTELVTGLVFVPSGRRLLSSSADGSLALFDAEHQDCPPLRVLANTVAHGDHYAPCALALSADGTRVAFVGPTEHVISVVDALTLDELLHIDVAMAVSSGSMPSDFIDSAVRVLFTPASIGQLLVVTERNRLLRLVGQTGRLISELHNQACTALAVDSAGSHLVTAGDRMVKVWDYHMRFDVNSQLFIGHSEDIRQVLFTNDGRTLISIGEAIFVWDFSQQSRPPSSMSLVGKANPARGVRFTPDEEPRQKPPSPRPPPRPVSATPQLDETITGEHEDDCPDGNSDSSANEPGVTVEVRSLQSNQSREESVEIVPVVEVDSEVLQGHISRQPPSALKHYQRNRPSCPMAERRYAAPAGQCGLQLHSVIGYNGRGRSNMVWHPATGLFAYTNGSVLIIEDLSTSKQRHFLGHSEEISTIALRHDCQVLASASGAPSLGNSQICLWHIESGKRTKVLALHEHEIICLAFSPDDRFLVSLGDFRERMVVVWDTHDYQPLASTVNEAVMHELVWDPFTANEMVSVGSDGQLLFWLLDEDSQAGQVQLKVHFPDVPAVITSQPGKSGSCEFTCVSYVSRRVLLVGTSSGIISAWSTETNSCFLHWQADCDELVVLKARGNCAVSGSTAGTLKFWSTDFLESVLDASPQRSLHRVDVLKQMTVDGAIVSASFDQDLGLGVVGTLSGTLWYINRQEELNIRLVSGHTDQVQAVRLPAVDERYMASCSSDGSVRVWLTEEREQTLQFQVLGKACNCLAFSPSFPSKAGEDARDSSAADTTALHPLPACAAGYSDGSLRLFNLQRQEMMLKTSPHSADVQALSFATKGEMLLSGDLDGLLVVSGSRTGITVRQLTEHRGAPITDLQVAPASLVLQDLTRKGEQFGGIWLAASADSRISVWSSDWKRDRCDLVDWLTFPTPAEMPYEDEWKFRQNDQSTYAGRPSTLARFSSSEPGVIVYTGFSLNKSLQFYSLHQKTVLRSLPISHWATCLDISPCGRLLLLGCRERLLRLMDYDAGSFQDYTLSCDCLRHVSFSPSGRLVFSVGHTDIGVWRVALP